MLSSKSSSSSTLVTYVEEQSYPDQKTSVRFFCSSKSGCLSWLSAKASFQGRDVSVPYRSNLLKFTVKFRIAFSKPAEKTAASELSISLAFTESPAQSQP